MAVSLTYPLDGAVCAAVANMSRAEANRYRDLNISEIEKKERGDIYEKIGFFKTVASIAAIASVILLVLFPSWFMGCMTALVLWGNYEARTVAANAQEVLDDFKLEAQISGNKRACLDQLSHGTHFSRAIIAMLWR